MCLASLTLLVGVIGGVAVSAPALVTQEIPIGFLPAEWVRATLNKALSTPNRFVFVHGGPVRITDTAERVEAARRAIEELQKAPALVPIEISFATTARRTVQRLPASPPVLERGFPYPTRFDPPRVIMNGSGGFTVIPSQPRDFTTRSVEPGTLVNPAPGGYATAQPEVRLSETTTTSAVARRFSVPGVPGKTVSITTLPQADAPAVHALAQKLGAIAATEPAWPSAATELTLKPELSGGALVVNIVPQVVLAQGRRVPLRACAAAVLIAPGALSNTGFLPRAEPEFFRIFLGAPQVEDDTFTTLTVKAQVQYIGAPPR